MKVGLFFGSFNPIHVGHLMIANIAKETADIDQVWFVVTPQNPFKRNKNLLHEFDRLDMVNAAIADDYDFRSCDIEFNLPKPNYTIHTLAHLSDKYPDHQFRLIIGEDNLAHFHKWKNYQEILNQFGLIVYPRPGVEASTPILEESNVKMIEAPKMDISATLIRSLLRGNKSVKYLVPQPVEELIKSKKFYQ